MRDLLEFNSESCFSRKPFTDWIWFEFEMSKIEILLSALIELSKEWNSESETETSSTIKVLEIF